MRKMVNVKSTNSKSIESRSRTSAFLTLASFLVVLASLLIGFFEFQRLDSQSQNNSTIEKLERQIEILENHRDKVILELENTNSKINSLKQDIRKLRDNSIANNFDKKVNGIEGELSKTLRGLKLQQNISNLTASSELNPQAYQGQSRYYFVENIIDGDSTTAWVEGVSGDGINEWLKVDFKQKMRVKEIKIVSGYAADQYRFDINNRVKKIKILFSDNSSRQILLEDSLNPQLIKIKNPPLIKWVKFEILEVYPGSKFQDTAVSELEFEMCLPRLDNC